jgi:hypothetical protein
LTSVRLRTAPSDIRCCSLPIGRPVVRSPKERVSGRPRKATATASPELAVERLVEHRNGG